MTSTYIGKKLDEAIAIVPRCRQRRVDLSLLLRTVARGGRLVAAAVMQVGLPLRNRQEHEAIAAEPNGD